METIQFQENGFEITSDLVEKNKVLVTDFFGDNRNWYEKLNRGGSTYGKTSLNSTEPFDVDLADDDKNFSDVDQAPLDPERIVGDRLKNIVNFFAEYQQAQEEFTRYYKEQSRDLNPNE